MDSNACRAGEVERNVWRDNDSLLRGQLLKRRSWSSAVSPNQGYSSGRPEPLSSNEVAATMALNSARISG